MARRRKLLVVRCPLCGEPWKAAWVDGTCGNCGAVISAAVR